MPKQPEKLWAWLIEQDQKALLAILAICAAMTVDAVEKKRGAALPVDSPLTATRARRIEGKCNRLTPRFAPSCRDQPGRSR
jgi:hypothetical protein